MNERMQRAITYVLAAGCALVAVFAAMVTVGEVVNGYPDWWQWPPMAILAAAAAWLNFREARASLQSEPRRLL